MRHSFNDILIFVDVYFEVDFIYIETIVVYNVVFRSCNFVIMKIFCNNLEIVNIFSMNCQKLLFSNYEI